MYVFEFLFSTDTNPWNLFIFSGLGSTCSDMSWQAAVKTVKTKYGD